MTEMEKDKLLDYMFDQNSGLMAQLSGIQEELRLVREGEEVRYRALAAHLERVLEELAASQRAAAVERSKAEEVLRLAAREAEARKKAEELVKELPAQLAIMVAKLESMADSSEVDALREQVVDLIQERYATRSSEKSNRAERYGRTRQKRSRRNDPGRDDKREGRNDG